jgi:hypothetical protein
MIELKTWGEFMFAFWKVVKKYQTVENFGDLMDEADKLMETFPQPVFRGFVLGFLEQKSFEGIRNQ